MDFFAGIQPPNERAMVNVDDLLKHSLNEAMTALCTRSKKQTTPSDSDFSNSGHIILFSNFTRLFVSFLSLSEFDMFLVNVLKQSRKMLESFMNLITIWLWK